MNELFKQINDSTERAKCRYNEQLSRFHVGDIVCPLYQKWFPTIWGTVVEIIPQIHKINVNLNGIVRQFEPEDLILTNPELKPGSDYNDARQKIVLNAEKKVKASFKAKASESTTFKDYFCNIEFDDGENSLIVPVKVSADSEETAEGLLNGFACKFMECHPENEDFKLGAIREMNDSLVEDGMDMYVVNPFGETSKTNSGNITASSESPLDPELASVKSYMTAYNRIMNKIRPLISGLKSDIGWNHIHEIVDTIGGMGVDVLPEGVNDSNYREDGGSKEWHYTLSFLNNDDERVEINLYIIASAAGSVNDPWDQYDIIIPIKGGKVVSRKKAEKNVKIIPQYKVWRDHVQSLANSEPVASGSAPKQYVDFIFDAINKITLADAECKKLDMESFKENVIDAMYAFKTAYEFGRKRLDSAEENQKLEDTNNLCNSLSASLGVHL